MEKPREALIAYDGLPVSAGSAHRLSANPVAVWAALSTFLQRCTDRESPETMHVRLYESNRQSSSLWQDQRSLLSEQFGTPHRRARVGTAKETIVETSWRLAAADLPRTLDWLSEQRSRPPSIVGAPLLVDALASFKLCAPDSGAVLPFQDPALYHHQKYPGGMLPLGISQFYVRLSETSTCSLILSLPFEDVSDDLKRIVAGLQAHLPFTLSANHWKRWKLHAAQGRYYPRKVAVL